MMLRFLRNGLIIAGLLLAAVQPVFAQTGGGRIVAYAPDASKFPNVSLTFEAYDAQGDFLIDLAQGEVQITENDKPAVVETLTRQQPGMNVIVAFNVAPGMAAAAVANGANRFDQVKKVVLSWCQSQPGKTSDELSLVTNAGPQVSRVTNALTLADALNAYTPDLAKAQSSLTSLTTALDLASDPSLRKDSKRAILYITAGLPDNALTALPSLTERAVQMGVHISTWLVLPKAGEERSARLLTDLAERTGGQFFTYTGLETLPSPETYFLPLRYQYRTSYISAARQNGAQRVQIAIRRAGFGDPLTQQYSINLQPPNPFFLSPPTRIQRSWARPAGSEQSVLLPAEVDLQAIVEFPDGLRRSIKASRLYVDGKLVYEMTAEPFNPLVWSLAPYTNSGKHVLRVEMEDILGLSHSSIEIPVDVAVDAAPVFDLNALLQTARPYLPWAGLGGMGILLGVGAVAGWRRVRGRGLWQKLWSRRVRSARSLPRQRADVPAPARPRPFANPNAPARLARVAEGSFALPGGFIALGQDEIRLGSDPRQADCILDEPAVNGLHVRITRTAEGRYIICDAGSESGTWVNYVLIPPEGVTLEHGDTIQFGRETFRFELKNPPPPRQPTVTVMQEDS
jgi:hypothetical protein